MSESLAHDILGLLGRGRRADDSLAIDGGNDPVFKTPWRIAHAGSAALGAIGLPWLTSGACAPERRRP
jgi:hypothetical protein